MAVVAAVVVLVAAVVVVSGQTAGEQKSNTTYFSNFCLTSLLQGPLLSSSAWFDILDHIKVRDRDVVACWGRSTSCIICSCPRKVDDDDEDDDESVKFASY